MYKFLLATAFIVIGLASCRKDHHDDFVSATLVQTGGCYLHGWLVSIDNPDDADISFLQAPTFPVAGYHRGNAVYIDIPSPLAAAGKKISFSVLRIEASCLSFSEAPNHIKVKELRGL